ncbi:hypothetical protein B7R54_07715 [Subtercola boreus]|uniref:ABC3 transporter permease C-terminal domain-containing protein n=1 Tax=Subtercola boreus TaxID=120213 RepID=A0A3E0VHK6_9MICO|nr:FtsX-like permease family protein [Subtercola boreus]RFA09125.1 hypothetical protein B7R54_07715 [Subtercola boreus]TQL53865.1 putative ABC transport system permease protein [Subtercola boreus]
MATSEAPRETLRRGAALLREAAVCVLSQRLASLLTVVVIAAVCVAVLATAGRAEGSANDVLSSLDDSGTRSIVVRAEPGSGLDTSVLDRLRMLGGIEWAGAFGAADDVTNAALEGGRAVSRRAFYGGDAASGARVSERAADQLGLSDGVGEVVSRASGEEVDITGFVELSPDLRFLEPVVLVPAPTPQASPVAVLVVRAQSAPLVAAVATAVTSVLGVDDPTTVTVQTSERLAAVRQQVENHLGDFGRGLVLSTFAGSSALVGAILFALVMMRRRDFGRRRALGASRSLLVLLLLSQVGLTAALASALGTVLALSALALLRQPLPTPAFTVAVAILATTTALVAAVLPALFASTRDPLRELRVP